MKCPVCNGKNCLEDLDFIYYCNDCGANIKKETRE